MATLNSKEFPAFYTRNSGFSSPCVVNSTSEAAAMLKSTMDLELKSGLLIAVPIPEKNALNSNIHPIISNNIITKLLHFKFNFIQIEFNRFLK